jgi:hypothetical protein
MPDLRPMKPTRALPILPPKRPEDTETAWADLWQATQGARETVAGRQITDAINSDPAEVARLRKARQDARAGLRQVE